MCLGTLGRLIGKQSKFYYGREQAPLNPVDIGQISTLCLFEMPFIRPRTRIDREACRLSRSSLLAPIPCAKRRQSRNVRRLERKRCETYNACVIFSGVAKYESSLIRLKLYHDVMITHITLHGMDLGHFYFVLLFS